MPEEELLFKWGDMKKIKELLNTPRFGAALQEEDDLRENGDGSEITGPRISVIRGGDGKVTVAVEGGGRGEFVAREDGNIYDCPKVIEEYPVRLARVTLYEWKGRGHYLINEPSMNEDEVSLYSRIQDAMRSSTLPSQVGSDITKLVMDTIRRFGLEQEALPVLDKLLYYIKRDQEGYWIQDVLMRDPLVEEIIFEGYSKGPVGIIHRKYSNYATFDTNIRFNDDDVPREIVLQLAARVGKPVNASKPLLEGMTPEVHRVAATFRTEASLPGSSWTIRKHLEEPLTMAQLVGAKLLSPLMGAYIWMLTEQKGFLEILGATASGKTTLLSASAGLFPQSEKVVTIEDTSEIKLPQTHWQQLVTRVSFGGESAAANIAIMDLLKYALRIRPDLLVPGESRGVEIHDLMQAVASGHGALTTFHAESPQAALARMRAEPLRVGESNLQLIWCFVLVTRLLLGSQRVRRVTLITEPNPFNVNEMKDVFKWDITADAFSPSTAEEVYEKSHRLSYSIPYQTGWTKEQIIGDLKARAGFLTNTGHLKYREFYEKVHEFYLRKYGTI
jgi:flagellar protein FlaI